MTYHHSPNLFEWNPFSQVLASHLLSFAFNEFIFDGELFTGGLIDDNTFMKVMNGLNETIGVVLEYLQDAKVTI